MSATRLKELFSELLTPHYTPTDSGVLLPTTQYADDFDIVSLMKEAHDPDLGVLRDLKIDTRDFHHASSYYDYAFNVIGKDAHPPWMVQGWIGLLLFGEVCPVCSDKRWLDLEWFVTNVPKSKPFKEIKEGLKVLRHGVCPKCKRFKWDLMQNHGLNNYSELVNVLGQRSGKSSSAAGYAGYLGHRYLMFPRLADQTNAMQKSTELTGTFVSLTFNKAVGVLWTPFINLVKESTWFCLGGGTPVLLADGTSCAIEDVKPGSMVKTLEGEHPVVEVYDNGVKDCFEVSFSNGTTLVGTDTHQVRCLGPSGDCLVWKSIKDLQPGDMVVTQ